MRRRKPYVATAALVLAITSIAAGTTGSAADRATTDRTHDPLRVLVLGNETFEPNVLIQATLRFAPERSYPHTGERVRWVDEDASEDPHTITIVRRSQLPREIGEVFACAACNEALEAHFSTDPPTFRVNVGAAGLDQPGDSLLLLPGESIGAQVSAPAGTNLSFLCAIHPWMQGRLVVA